MNGASNVKYGDNQATNRSFLVALPRQRVFVSHEHHLFAVTSVIWGIYWHLLLSQDLSGEDGLIQSASSLGVCEIRESWLSVGMGDRSTGW